MSEPGKFEQKSAISGWLLFGGLAAVFLFGLNYGWLWPLFLIAAGLLLLPAPILSRSR